MSETFAAVEPLLAEHADIEAQLADPSVHADAGRARTLGRRPHTHRSPGSGRFRPPARFWHNVPLASGSRGRAALATRGHPSEEIPLKTDIHPEYVVTEVTCTCGNTFTTRSTVTSGKIHADVCSACHPFYTGKQKILDTGGRVARFEARYGKKPAN